MLRQLCLRGIVVATLGMTWMLPIIVETAETRVREIPCPYEEDILPCVCTAQPDFSMDMDCSAATSSNELALAFSAEFPFLDFDNLFIINNTYITTLRVGDLGQATFQRISISHGRLETVVDGALENSYESLLALDLSYNELIDFNFDELSLFQFLDELNVQYNKLSSFPHIYSSSLRTLQFGYNPLETISPTALKDLTNLEDISLISTQLTSLDPGTLTGLPKLQIVHLENNYLTTLRGYTIEVTGPATIVHLNNNFLNSIEVNAIQGANYQVWINNNELTELTEDVWRPMFDAEVRLSARENPFTCGCDIAWIVLDANYLSHLVDDPTCRNGDYIYELDPSVFNELCT